MKSLIYRFAMYFARRYWKLIGGRRIRVFGYDLRWSWNTAFPGSRHLPLPSEGYPLRIVQYADFVQMHSMCRYIADLHHQPVIIDVGAHHGTYAILIGLMIQQSQGRVVALEPDPENFKILQTNVSLNQLQDTVICRQVAVANTTGHSCFIPQGSQGHLASEPIVDGLRVTVLTLRDILRQHAVEHVDMLLIDVEGAELPVLLGYPWGRIGVGRIYCELHPYAWHEFGYNGRDFKDFLEKRGYRCYDMYFHEHLEFTGSSYIGPTLLIPQGVRS